MLLRRAAHFPALCFSPIARTDQLRVCERSAGRQCPNLQRELPNQRPHGTPAPLPASSLLPFILTPFFIRFYQYFSSLLMPCFPSLPPSSHTAECNLHCSLWTLCALGQFAMGQIFSIAFSCYFPPLSSHFCSFSPIPPPAWLQVCHQRKALNPHPAPIALRGFICISAQHPEPIGSVLVALRVPPYSLLLLLFHLGCFFGREPCARGEGRRAAASAFK